MTIECPDCGKSFRAAKCSCGYDPKVNSAANAAVGAERFQKMRSSLDAIAITDLERSKANLSVLATVNVSGGLRWAHEILALHSAGLYRSEYSLKLAREVLKRGAE